MSNEADPVAVVEPASAIAAPKKKIGSVIRFALETFGPLIAFYAFEHLFGLVPAIISGIVSGALIVALQIARDRKISPFTAFIAISVVLFGALDLHYRTGFFVKIEPALGNVLTGLFFLGTVIIGRPIIIEFAEKQMGRKLDRAHGYLRGWTIAWAIYFFARAATYVWMAYHLTVDQALAIRGVAGPASFGVMFVVEIGTRKVIFRNVGRANVSDSLR